MKQKIGILILALLICFVIVDIIKNKIEKNEQLAQDSVGYVVDLNDEKVTLKENEVAPNIEFTNLDGEVKHLSDYEGKKVILNFWATWCPPCKAEMPHMQKFYDKNDVEIIGFNMTFSGDSDKKVKDFVASYKLTFPIYTTNDSSIADLYQIKSMPTTYFIDEERRVKGMYIGPLDQKKLKYYYEEWLDG